MGDGAALWVCLSAALGALWGTWTPAGVETRVIGDLGDQRGRECCFSGCAPAEFREAQALAVEVWWLRCVVLALLSVIGALILLLAWALGIVTIRTRAIARRTGSPAGSPLEAAPRSARRSGPVRPSDLRHGHDLGHAARPGLGALSG